MTEKQYKVGYFEDPNPVDDYVECGGEYLNASDTVRLLNQFQKENKQLKQLLECSREEANEYCEELMSIEATIELYEDINKHLKQTTQELYDFRLMYNALLFNEWSKHDTIEVYKSKKHSDGELCFNGEWFVVVAILPSGQITNHYHMEYWDYFKIPSYEQVKDEFDGHNSSDVLDRLYEMIV